MKVRLNFYPTLTDKRGFMPLYKNVITCAPGEETVLKWRSNIALSDRSSAIDYERAINERIARQADGRQFDISDIFILTPDDHRLLIEAQAKARERGE